MPGWGNSTRRLRLPPGWSSRIVPAILRRDPVCTCPGPSVGCSLHLGRPCSHPSSEVDHLVPNDDHSPANLAGKCAACHMRKTVFERRRPYQPPRRRPPVKHPGLLT